MKDERLTSSTAPFVCASCPFFLAQQRRLWARGRPCVRACVRSSFRVVGSSSPLRGPSLQSSTAVVVPAFGCRGSFRAVVVVVVCFIKEISRLDRSKGREREREREGKSSERPVTGSSEDGFSIGRE